MGQLTLTECQRPVYAPEKLARLRIMIDKETLSTRPNAAFISLSAVVMDFDAKSPNESLLNRFNMYVKIESAFAYAESGAGHIDPQTIMWWFRQCDAARMDQANGQDDARNMGAVLVRFNYWVEDMANLYGVPRDRIELWSCGPMQDQNWLEHAWRSSFPDSDFSQKPAWPWWGVRCGRSFLSTYYKVKEGVANEGTLHVGIDDCCNQARKLFAIIRSIDRADPDLRNVSRQEDGSFRDRDDFSPLNIMNIDVEETTKPEHSSSPDNQGQLIYNWQVTTVNKDGLSELHKGMSQVQAYSFAENWYQDNHGCKYPEVSREPGEIHVKNLRLGRRTINNPEE